MQNIKQLYSKLNSLPFYKSAILEPIIEVLFFVLFMIFRSIYSAAFVIGKHCFPLGLNGTGTLLLELGLAKENIFIVIFSFFPLILKILSVIGVLKKKKNCILVLCAIYLSDFLCGLISLSDLYSTGVLLQEFPFFDKVMLIICGDFPVVVSAFLLFVYFNFETSAKIKIINKDKNNYKILLYLIILSVAFVFTFAYNCTDRNFATNEEIALLNRCYNYSEKYLYNVLPEDESELESIQKDIDAVLEEDVFKRAFSKSKYEERFLEAQKIDEKEFYNATTEKSRYANELIFLKCKILLALNKNEEFISYYQENQHFFGCWTDTFFDYLDGNLGNFTEDDITIIDKCMRNVLESQTSEINKFFAYANLVNIHKNSVNYEVDIKPKLLNLKNKYINDFSTEIWSNYNNKLSNAQNCLYILRQETADKTEDGSKPLKE